MTLTLHFSHCGIAYACFAIKQHQFVSVAAITAGQMVCVLKCLSTCLNVISSKCNIGKCININNSDEEPHTLTSCTGLQSRVMVTTAISLVTSNRSN